MSLAQRLALTDGARLSRCSAPQVLPWLSETPHDASQLFTPRRRALGFAALILAGTYLLFPDTIVDGHLVASALFVSLLSGSRP
jgi:hypothetical protein